jgi:hypothetical protein
MASGKDCGNSLAMHQARSRDSATDEWTRGRGTTAQKPEDDASTRSYVPAASIMLLLVNV